MYLIVFKEKVMIKKDNRDFKLLETILYRSGKLVLCKEHIERVRNSQLFFDFTWNLTSVERALKEATDALSLLAAKFAKVRLLVSHDGTAVAEYTPMESEGWGKESLSFFISDERTNSENIFLYHKTTNRDFYNNHYRNAVEHSFDEVLFMNEKGEITEGAISNIFIKKDNLWLTPPVECGLLPGVWRKTLINDLNAAEYILRKEDIEEADEIVLCNSLRGAVNAALMP